jgi:peptidoglycan hydrolase FlgJ
MTPMALDTSLASMTAGALAGTPRMTASTTASKARAQANDFETMFLSNMFQSMFTDIKGDGPMGASQGVAPWRSFMTQEYAKSVVKAGGIGLSDQIYRSLLAQQEARAK